MLNPELLIKFSIMFFRVIYIKYFIFKVPLAQGKILNTDILLHSILTNYFMLQKLSVKLTVKLWYRNIYKNSFGVRDVLILSQVYYFFKLKTLNK